MLFIGCRPVPVVPCCSEPVLLPFLLKGNAMAYPNAFCVKCGTHTNTEQKHTVVLSNSSRALKGVCPKCSSKVFKILPKGKSFNTTIDSKNAGSKVESKKLFPRAYCVKCQDFTPTLSPKTVVLKNGSRAMKGNCQKCGSESYRILGKERLRSVHPGEQRIAPTRRADKSASVANLSWALWLGFGMITGAVAAALFLI